MLLSAVSVLVVAQSSSEIPDGLVNNPVYSHIAMFIQATSFGQSMTTIQSLTFGIF